MDALVRARRTIVEVLRHRGYQLQPHIVNETAHTVYDKYSRGLSALTLSAFKPDEKDVVLVVFDTNINNFSSTVGVTDIVQYGKVFAKTGVNHAIIVVCNKMTPMAQKLLARQSVRIEVFRLDCLQVNILNHSYVPKHERVSRQEHSSICKKYGFLNLPVIFTTDPVIRLCGFVDGDIVRVIRPDFTAGVYVMYRRVATEDLVTAGADGERPLAS